MSLSDNLKAELKAQIRRDMEPHGKWNEARWTKTKFGDYYGKSAMQLVTIHQMAGSVVNRVLARIEDGFQMTPNSWAGLQEAIDATDTAETALPDMEDAARNAQKIKPG